MSDQKTISIIGNCQAEIVTKFIRVLCPDLKVHRFGHSEILNQQERAANEKILEASDYVFTNPLRHDQYGKFSFANLKDQARTHFFNPVSFAGFQPDCVYLGLAKAIPRSSPVGDYNSSIAVFAYLQGASVAETVDLYNDTVYRELGFYDVWKLNRDALIRNYKNFDIDLSDDFEVWKRHGLFMYTINHPYAFVMRDITKHLLTRAGIPMRDVDPVKFVSDRGADDIVWPVYPEIAEHLGVQGEMTFKASDRWVPRDEQPRVFGLEDFVRGSFASYEKMRREDLVCRSIAMPHQKSLEVVGDLLTRYRQIGAAAFARRQAARTSRHPYADLPPHQFWRKAIATVKPEDVDPVVSMPFVVNPTDRVATAGSCFAQHIAARLSRQGFNYLVTETAPAEMPPEEAKAKNYGVFSARYGNIYTTRQLLQLIERVYGRFTPVDSVWAHPDGGFVDPFRPQIEPGGFATIGDLERARSAHFAAVKRIFEQADLFVFTLGLTESWRSKRDGAVFPLAPGVAGGDFDTDQYEFVNFSAAEVTADLVAFIERLRVVNEKCRILLTVSPVPLIATYDSKHVLVSTTYSKSVLRVAAEEVCAQLDRVHYFPSYEIIVGNFNKGAYFEEDMRSVRTEGVDHVMRLFFRHLTQAGRDAAGDTSVADAPATAAPAATPAPAAAAAVAATGESEDFSQRISKLDEVVCDEEALDR
jgi:hypothetical protein